MSHIIKIPQAESFLMCLYKTYELYFKHGSRSYEKVNYFHSYIKNELEDVFLKENGYDVKLEQNIPSINSSGRKRCDIVVFKHDKPYIVLPVKIIMTNYKQNKNNSWENLTGELIHLKWANPELNIVPINIILNSVPYLKKDKIISKFETITYDDISNYEYLVEKNIAYSFMNYIIDVTHSCEVGGRYTLEHIPVFEKFNVATPFREYGDIFADLLS